MAYNLDAIKAKINQLSGNGKTGAGGKDRPRINFWKPELGQHNIRFLPYADDNGQPFQEVSYYDSRLISERRFVAGAQFGMEDPVLNLLTELKKDRSKEAWKLWKNLQPKERYYAPIIVRGQEEKGVQIWELNSKLLKDIYGYLAHPDYKDENLMHAETGYDFTITVSPTDKLFNGNPVKEIKLQPRRKPSAVSDDAEEAKKFLEGIPDLRSYFKAQVRSNEEIDVMLSNFLAGNSKDESGEAASVESVEVATPKTPGAVTGGTEVTAPGADATKVKKAKKSIDDAFDDL